MCMDEVNKMQFNAEKTLKTSDAFVLAMPIKHEIALDASYIVRTF